MKFAAVIVSYNRRKLLEECLSCIFNQTVPFDTVCVIDNHSTDGSWEYLKSLTYPSLKRYRLKKNIGGAGGFSCGLRKLASCKADYILILDDDAMLSATYMEEIQKAILKNNYLAYSGTVMTAGSIDVSHRRRITNHVLMFYTPVKETAYSGEAFVYDVSTFCGLVIRSSLLHEIGFPKSEYFIWFDDTEYCLRFNTRSRILNVNRAILNHKTIPPKSAPAISWKHYYGFRNSIDIGKTYSSCPPLYLSYIAINHMTHILIDYIALALIKAGFLKNTDAPLRRYRIRVYLDVLAGWQKKPAGLDVRYPPGSGP